MAAPRNRRHVFVHTPPEVEAYQPHPRRVDTKEVPAPPSRAAHGAALKESLKKAAAESQERRVSAAIQVHGAEPGLYIEFESQPGVELNLSGLENKTQKIELVAVTEVTTDEPKPRRIQKATIFVPDGKLKHFITRLEKYALETPKQKGERRHEDMVDRIGALRLATLRALWTDVPNAYPEDTETLWWEVWLRRHDGGEIGRLMEFAALASSQVDTLRPDDRSSIQVSDRRLEFDERIVTLVRATPRQLSASLDVLNDLAEVRKAKETATFFVDMSPEEQAEWVKDLRARTTPPPAESPAVCILDTGVTRGHPLLQDALLPDDRHACDPSWGLGDHHGHGTEMAGLALYGDLTPVLASTDPVVLRHRLESVKILPPGNNNPPDLYGAITAEAASRVDIQAPTRRRCFSLAVTAPDEQHLGQPTSWSAAIDALAAGRGFDPSEQGLVYLSPAEDVAHRLFLVSAGNVSQPAADHLNRSDTEAVHDPAQAWNALTVGACTEKAIVRDPSWQGWTPVAMPGELSPWSTTSLTFSKPWPIKPDVVFEGGNVVRNAAGEVDFPVPDLEILSTHYKPAEKTLVLSSATSAATAQVARIAAVVSAEYPDFWPETIRGLIVHSARWTRAMQAHLQGAAGKRARARLVQRYGFGVPSLERTLRSADDALTLIVQGTVHPFAGGKMREMRLHDLPWPREVLAGLGETSVQLRVTLSYFVEPNPGRRGWQKRHRYASHGLRFQVKGATESTEDFRKRLNKQALEEEEKRPSGGSDSSEWYLGEQARNRGSLHSDLWVGTAADLAERGVVGIYPVTGWWKEQPKRDRSHDGARYALIVSIETQATDVDIWTPVALQVGIPTEIAAIGL